MKRERCPNKPFLQSGHSAYYKSKSVAKKCARINDAKLKRTNHTIRGKGWLVYR